MNNRIYTLFFLILTVLPSQVYSQESGNSKTYSIGINIFSLRNFDNQNWHLTNQETVFPQFPSGLFFAYYNLNNRFQFSIDLTKGHNEINESAPEGQVNPRSLYNKSNWLNTEFSLGYRKLFSKSKIKPLLGADLLLASVSEKGDHQSSSCGVAGCSQIELTEYKANYLLGGGRIEIGFDIKITSKISGTLTSMIDVLHQFKYESSLPIIYKPQKFFNWNWQPLRVSLSYNL